MAEQTFQGGCLCGRIRYWASGEPHTALLSLPDVPARRRRAVDRLGQLPARGLHLDRAEPAYYRSSPYLRRGFCPTCGASICTIADDDGYVCITMASLDDPERIAPGVHMWTSTEVSWLKVDDRLPRCEGQG